MIGFRLWRALKIAEYKENINNLQEGEYLLRRFCRLLVGFGTIFQAAQSYELLKTLATTNLLLLPQNLAANRVQSEHRHYLKLLHLDRDDKSLARASLE